MRECINARVRECTNARMHDTDAQMHGIKATRDEARKLLAAMGGGRGVLARGHELRIEKHARR
jgi:hypothetical protein